MTSINTTAQLVSYLRSRLQRPSSAPQGSTAKARRVPGALNESAASSIGSATDLETLIAQRVAAIDASGPDRSRKAFRVFLESVLLTEIGEQLITDPGFHLLVDRVQEQIESDPELCEQALAAGAELLRVHGKPQ